MIPHFFEKLWVAITVLKANALLNIKECTRCTKNMSPNNYEIISILTVEKYKYSDCCQSKHENNIIKLQSEFQEF